MKVNYDPLLHSFFRYLLRADPVINNMLHTGELVRIKRNKGIQKTN